MNEPNPIAAVTIMATAKVFNYTGTKFEPMVRLADAERVLVRDLADAIRLTTWDCDHLIHDPGEYHGAGKEAR